MPKLTVESLRPGMVVSADVKTSNDTLLIPAGCALTEKQIGMLDTWGIAEIHVQSSDGFNDSGDPLEALPPETRRQLAADLAAVFWTTPDASPVQRQVFNLA